MIYVNVCKCMYVYQCVYACKCLYDTNVCTCIHNTCKCTQDACKCKCIHIVCECMYTLNVYKLHSHTLWDVYDLKYIYLNMHII